MGGAAKAVGSAVSSVGKAAGDVVQGTVNSVSRGISSATDKIGNELSDINWTEIRDSAEAAAVVAGNYYLPGSSMVTSKLVSDGAQEKLNSDLGRTAQVASGVSGGVNGNMSNWTGGPSAPVTGGEGEALGSASGGSSGASTLGETSGATSAPVSSGSVQASTINTQPLAPVSDAVALPPVTDAVATPVPAGTVQDITSGGMGGLSAGEVGAYAVGTKLIGDYVEKKMTPEVEDPATGGTATSAMIDMTAGEKRATADDVANVMSFQSQASQRKRLAGAQVLAGNSAGSTTVGSKALLGA